MITASKAAAKVRQAIKRQGNNPTGMVSIKHTDYTTEVEVNLRGVYGAPRENIEEAINEIDDGDFGWDVF